MEEAQAGGNSIASGQTVIVPAPDDLDTFKKYLIACSQPNPIPEEYVDFMAKEFSDQRGWIQATVDKIGYELGYVGGRTGGLGIVSHGFRIWTDPALRAVPRMSAKLEQRLNTAASGEASIWPSATAAKTLN